MRRVGPWTGRPGLVERAVSADLAAYLASIDEGLLGYLDAQKELAAATLAHVQRYAVALAERLLTPADVAEDWQDFFELAEAFVLAYGSPHLDHLYRRVALLDAPSVTGRQPAEGSDRLFLAWLAEEIGRRLPHEGGPGGPGGPGGTGDDTAR